LRGLGGRGEELSTRHVLSGHDLLLLKALRSKAIRA
jgi:hypothetical protein